MAVETTDGISLIRAAINTVQLQTVHSDVQLPATGYDYRVVGHGHVCPPSSFGSALDWLKQLTLTQRQG